MARHVRVFKGDNCEVKDPRHGNLYDLKPLSLNDTVVRAGEYIYYFRVCGQLSSDVCPTNDKSRVISSCQEKRGPQGFQRVAGTTPSPLLWLQNSGLRGSGGARKRASGLSGRGGRCVLTELASSCDFRRSWPEHTATNVASAYSNTSPRFQGPVSLLYCNIGTHRTSRGSTF